MTAPSSLDAPGLAPATSNPRLWRTLSVLLPANVALIGLYQGIQGVMLPAQIEAIDPVNKVGILGVLGAIASILGAIMLPLAGAVSDRTHGRFGRRAPWLVLSSLVCLVLAFGMGISTSIVALAVTMGLLWASACWYQGVLYAIIPDRIPVHARGTASSVIGLSVPLGILIFVNLVARVDRLTGYLLVGGILVAATIAFVLIAPEPRALPRERETRVPGEQRHHLFSPFKNLDFTLVFTSRILFFFGYFAVAGYLYYLVTDYIGLENVPGGDPAAAVASIATISTISQIIAVVIFGKLADVLDRRKLIVGLSAFAMAISLAVPLAMPTWTGMIIYAVINGAALGVYFAVDIALMSLVLPREENAGRDMGTLSVATSAAAALSPLIGAGMIGAFGSYTSVFWFSIVCATLGGIAVLLIKRIR